MAARIATVPVFYTVVQYVPNPIANDRISVGVIVFGDGKIRSQFLQDWSMVRGFAGEDIGFLREFADRIDDAARVAARQPTQAALLSVTSNPSIAEKRILEMVGEWSNSIQLTEPEPSLQNPDALLATMASAFLREPQRSPQQFRNRQGAVRLAVHTVRQAVERRVGSKIAMKALQTQYPVAGKLVTNVRVDLAVKNGRVYEAMRALSFETHDMSELATQATLAAYSLGDIHARNRNVRVTAYALPPNPELLGYDNARQQFSDFKTALQKIDARLVIESEADEWAEQIADLVQSEIAPEQR